MRPARAALGWNVPAIAMTGELADWLGLTVSELHWFADLKWLGCKRNVPRLRHYHYRVLAKESGDPRLIEAPKKRLKRIAAKNLAGDSREDSGARLGARVSQRSVQQDVCRTARGPARRGAAGFAGFLSVLKCGPDSNLFPDGALSGGRCRLARRNLCERGAAGRVERGWAGGGPAAFATSPRSLFPTAPAARGVHITGACQLVLLWGGLPLGGVGEVGRGRVTRGTPTIWRFPRRRV